MTHSRGKSKHGRFLAVFRERRLNQGFMLVSCVCFFQVNVLFCVYVFGFRLVGISAVGCLEVFWKTRLHNDLLCVE